jgi:hypothetical protein
MTDEPRIIDRRRRPATFRRLAWSIWVRLREAAVALAGIS